MCVNSCPCFSYDACVCRVQINVYLLTYYARSHGSADASLSLDVSVAATPVPHPNPISPYANYRISSIIEASGFY